MGRKRCPITMSAFVQKRTSRRRRELTAVHAFFTLEILRGTTQVAVASSGGQPLRLISNLPSDTISRATSASKGGVISS